MKTLSPQKLAEELGIHKRQMYEWRDQLRRHRGEPPTREEQLKQEIQQSASSAGQGGAGSGFLARCLAKNRGSTPGQRRLWRNCIYEEIRRVEQAQEHLGIEWMCRVAGVSRAGFYRDWQEREPEEEAMELRARIQQIVVGHRRCYGYRRVTKDLKDQGWRVNHKRVARLMTQDNLLAIRRRKYIVTTQSEHDQPVFGNLAATLKLGGINQLWVADITYIRLRRQFLYLAVVLDAYSRRVVGWALDESLEASLPLAALRQAIAERKPGIGLVHHSDRGTQYASREYIAVLEEYGIEPSMSRAGRPYDNARCESFMKTLKQEEIYTRQYHDRADLKLHIAEFLEQYYNQRRLHSALGYRSPASFEQSLHLPTAQLSFLGMRKSIVPMPVQTRRNHEFLPAPAVR